MGAQAIIVMLSVCMVFAVALPASLKASEANAKESFRSIPVIDQRGRPVPGLHFFMRYIGAQSMKMERINLVSDANGLLWVDPTIADSAKFGAVSRPDWDVYGNNESTWTGPSGKQYYAYGDGVYHYVGNPRPLPATFAYATASLIEKSDAHFWSAWNWSTGTNIIVYEIIDPQALLAYRLQVPSDRRPPFAEGKEYGVDLIKGSWMPPWGTGERADVMISVGSEVVLAKDFGRYELFYGGPMIDRSATSAVNTWIQYRFPHPGEGGYIAPQQRPVRSEFTGPHQAATSGYQSVLRWSRMRFSEVDLHDRQHSAFPPVFRIRVSATATMRLPDGTVVPRQRWAEAGAQGAIDEGGCIYGRMFRPSTTELLVFINPNPLSRSMEPDLRFLSYPPGTEKVERTRSDEPPF